MVPRDDAFRRGEERSAPDAAARLATALKANDDVQAKLRSALSELEKLKEASGQNDASTAARSKRIVTLQLQLRAQEEELNTLRARQRK